MNNRNNDTEVKPDVIAGRNPVSEAIRSGRPIDKILAVSYTHLDVYKRQLPK